MTIFKLLHVDVRIGGNIYGRQQLFTKKGT